MQGWGQVGGAVSGCKPVLFGTPAPASSDGRGRSVGVSQYRLVYLPQRAVMPGLGGQVGGAVGGCKPVLFGIPAPASNDGRGSRWV